MFECQSECYTPLVSALSNQLGIVLEVDRFIRRMRSSAISISEAKVEAISNPSSNISKLLHRLRSLGYEINTTKVFESNHRAHRAMAMFKDFDKEILKPWSEKNERLEQANHAYLRCVSPQGACRED